MFSTTVSLQILLTLGACLASPQRYDLHMTQAQVPPPAPHLDDTRQAGLFGTLGTVLAPVVGAVVGPLLNSLASGLTTGLATGIATGFGGAQALSYDAYMIHVPDQGPYLFLTTNKPSAPGGVPGGAVPGSDHPSYSPYMTYAHYPASHLPYPGSHLGNVNLHLPAGQDAPIEAAIKERLVEMASKASPE